MAAMQVRTAAYQTLLNNEFTQMNVTMAKYKQMGAALTQATNSTNNTSG